MPRITDIIKLAIRPVCTQVSLFEYTEIKKKGRSKGGNEIRREEGKEEMKEGREKEGR